MIKYILTVIVLSIVASLITIAVKEYERRHGYTWRIDKDEESKY